MIERGRGGIRPTRIFAGGGWVQYRRILVPITGGPGDRRVLDLASILAAKRNSEVVLVYVVEVKQSLPLDADMPQEVAHGEACLAEAERYARGQAEPKIHRVFPELLQARTAGAAIVDEAIERNCDVIVMACKLVDYRGQPTMGETAQYVLRSASCEVILTREATDL
ncbi:MAG TPA: universal stress protein [Chloroflexi bacterium]|nr:universal stress protein [Chloroflexota bacterium]